MRTVSVPSAAWPMSTPAAREERYRSMGTVGDCCKSALFVLIVKKNDGDDAQLTLAGMARRHFALQVLQKAVGKTVESSLAPCVLLVASAAVGTNKFDGVLLRIAVQSRPTGAANPESFGMLPVHGISPPGILVLV
jgi:hypothetical protein